MKTLYAPKDLDTREPRCPLSPDSIRKLSALGLDVIAHTGIGLASGFSDEAFQEAGAKVVKTADESVAPDVVLRIHPPDGDAISKMKQGAIHLSFLDPFNDIKRIEHLAEAGVSAISMEMIPRSTLAQKMDALSSQANLAGYFAVIKASEVLGKVLPMMMTPAGTIAPAKVFVVGVGVAGLQAIATAKRLGAQVEAFDTRPEVEEQVRSLGGKFLKIDLGETGQTKQGYANALTPEQMQKQKEGMKKACAQADIVITTAKLFGRPAPILIDAGMVDVMKRGSVIVDLAVETGGNVQGSELGQIKETGNGVRIVGLGNFEGYVAKDATLMLASNFANLLEHFWDQERGDFVLDPENEILKGCLITHGGAIVHEKFKS
jgi:NAD(P) transhydrogenase subunit alpha